MVVVIRPRWCSQHPGGPRRGGRLLHRRSGGCRRRRTDSHHNDCRSGGGIVTAWEVVEIVLTVIVVVVKSIGRNCCGLTATAFKDIASLVQNQAEVAVQGKSTAGRRRINSIVPCHQMVATPAVPQAPGWISGTESPGGGGRGRGFNNGQRWSRGRGRGNRSYPY